MLEEAGADVTVIDYRKHPPDAERLSALYARAGISPRESLRTKEPLARELGLLAAEVSDEAVLAAMAAHPILIERPLVETDSGVRLCRPVERVQEIL